jgi:lipid A 3-O-deacylase
MPTCVPLKPIAFCLSLYCGAFATTVAAEDAIEFTLGKASDQVDVLRVAWRKSWSSRWFVSATGELTGFHAFSINHWQGDDDSLAVIAYSPVFVYDFNKAPVSYVKLGVGAAWLSDTTIQTRNLSSYFQFEDQLGMGWRWGVHDLSLVYMHYSNAGFVHPNDGIDMVVLAYARRI